MDDSLDGLLGAAVFLGVSLPLTYGLIKMTERNVNELIKQGKKTNKRQPVRKRKSAYDPYPTFKYPKFKF